MEALTLDTIENILLIAASVLFFIQVFYYFYLYNRIYIHNNIVRKGNANFSQELPPISVIICTREASESLRDNLTAVLEQDYPQFEVIVINDGGTDKSEDYLTLLEEKYPHFYHSFVPDSSRYISHRKLAITLGVKASKYDWLVFIEAKCMPQSDQWLRLMARNFTPHTQIVLGYSGYEPSENWLQKKICFDNLFTSMRYLGFALAGSPYMGIGRNLAYRKTLFYQHKGFSAQLNLQRGDDDLFINHIANSENTRVETDANAAVRMQAITVAKNWKEEKISYASTARLYKGMQRWILGFETFTRLAFYASWIGAFVLAFLNFHYLIASISIVLFLLRFIMQTIIFNKTGSVLQDKEKYYSCLPIFDLLQPIQSLNWKLHCLFRNKREFLRK